MQSKIIYTAMILATLVACSKKADKKNPSPGAEKAQSSKTPATNNKPSANAPTPTANAPVSHNNNAIDPNMLVGGYASDCLDFGREDGLYVQKFIIFINDKDYYREIQLYRESDCNSNSYETVEDGSSYQITYQLVGADTRPNALEGQMKLNWIMDGVTYYDIVSMSGDRNFIQFGDTSAGNNTSEANRPMTWGSMIYNRVF